MPETVYRIVLTESDGPCICSFRPTEWWDWIHTTEPALPEGQSSINPGEGDMPDSLWELYEASGMGMSLTSGSYENDKAMLVYYALDSDDTAYEEVVRDAPAGESPEVIEYHGFMY